ncbi:MAG: FtsX-like permease family protein, partial [Acidobacteria bacterium]|nr:FtsX-like permease family protein [Acidobacteriota bacterium]
QLNGTAFTVVGVAPRDFVAAGTGDPAIEAWIPSAMFRVGYRYCDAFARDCKVVRLLGRLKPDHTLAEAQQELSLLAQQLATAYPETNKGRGIVVTPARGIGPDDQKEYSGSLMLLLCAVAVVLLISCANVAGLLLARSLKRRKEVAVRLALGASRGRLVRQLLTESLLLAGLGGLLGLLVAFWAKDVISSFYAVNYAGRAMNFSLSLSPLVLLASIALTLITGVVFGLIPAVQSTRTDLTTALKSETPVIGKSRGHLRDILVITQVALSIVLLVAAGLLVRSLASIYRGPGYDPSQVVLVRLRPSLVGYDLQKGWAFQREVIRRLETVPGVVSASTAFYNAHEGGNDFRLWTPGHDPDKKEDAYTSRGNMVGPRFFETLKVSLLDGRDFTELDREGAPKVAIVNDVLARHFWPNQNAVGQSLIVDGKSTQVIGTVRDLHFYAFGEGPRPYLYLSYWQQGARDWNDSRTQVRVAGDPRAMLQIIRREITAVDPSVPINEDYPMTDRLRFQFRIVRGAETALVSLSGLALFLSAIGVYGVLAFAVSQRTREIGIRMALGASRRNVAGLVLRNGLAVTLIGVCLGLGGAMVLTRLMASLLYGISATDPVSFIAGAVLLLSVASIATYVPTRAAMRVDPMVALRYE